MEKSGFEHGNHRHNIQQYTGLFMLHHFYFWIAVCMIFYNNLFIFEMVLLF